MKQYSDQHQPYINNRTAMADTAYQYKQSLKHVFITLKQQKYTVEKQIPENTV